MIKFSKLRFFKALFSTCSLMGSYIVSILLSTLIILDSLNGIFEYFVVPFLVGTVAIIVSIFALRLHTVSYRNASVNELVKVFIVALIVFPLNLITLAILGTLTELWGWAIITALFLFVFGSFSIFSYRLVLFIKFTLNNKKSDSNKPNVLIVGAGIAGVTILREIQQTDKIELKAIGFVDDSPAKIGSTILGVKVLGNRKCYIYKQ